MSLTLLHTGIGHPDLTLLVLTAVLSFAAGTGTAMYSRFRDSTIERDETPAEN